MLLQLVKIWRIILYEDSSDAHRGFWQGILTLISILLFFAHVFACSFLAIGNFEVAHGAPSWLDLEPHGLDMTHCVVRYTESFYFAVIGLTSVGYGDLLVTPLEHGFNAFFLLISQLFAAKVCAELTWLTSMYNQHEASANERRRSLLLALEKMGVSKVLVKRILAFQSFENTMHTDNMEKETFQGLGKNLMQELRLCAYRKLVLQAPFLREQPTEVISFIVESLSDSVFLPADFIVRAGEHGRELYFVRRGEARAYLGNEGAPIWGKSTEVAIVKAGSYFGELAMLTGLPRGSYVMATSYCICSVLPYGAVEDLVDMHPEAFTTLVQTMVKMYKLRADMSWRGLSKRLFKKYGLRNDWDVFAWLKGHGDNPDEDELHAKAFDMALQKLRVSHLDRRIFWSELDRDASGGISFSEFTGKLTFPSLSQSEENDPETPKARELHARASKQSCLKKQPATRSPGPTQREPHQQRRGSADRGVDGSSSTPASRLSQTSTLLSPTGMRRLSNSTLNSPNEQGVGSIESTIAAQNAVVMLQQQNQLLSLAIKTFQQSRGLS